MRLAALPLRRVTTLPPSRRVTTLPSRRFAALPSRRLTTLPPRPPQAVVARPELVEAIRRHVVAPLDRLAFEMAFAPQSAFSLDLTSSIPLTDGRAARLAARLAGAGQLVALDLAFSAVLTDAGLARLAAVSSLRRLELAGAMGLTDRGVSRLSRLTRLQDLGLAHVGVGDAGLAALAATLDRTLTRLDLLGCTAITPAGIASLASFSRLVSLRTPNACQKPWTTAEIDEVPEDNGRQRRAGVAEALALARPLRAMPSLLRLSAPSAGQARLAHAGPLHSLRSLELWRCEDVDLRLIGVSMPALTRLSLLWAPPPPGEDVCYVEADDVAAAARGLPNLRHLTLAGAVLFDARDELSGFSSLERLDMRACIISKSGDWGRLLAPLRLTHLQLPEHCSVSDDAFADICRLLGPTLRELRASTRALTAAGIGALSALTACTSLTVLNGGDSDSEDEWDSDDDDEDRHIDDISLPGVALAALPLRKLRISKVSADTRAQLARLAPHLTRLELVGSSWAALTALPVLSGSLQHLSICWAAAFEAADYSAISALTRLTHLKVADGGRWKGAFRGDLCTLRSLSALRELKLDVAAAAFSEAGLATVCSLPSLRRLSLRLDATRGLTFCGLVRALQLPATVRFAARDRKGVALSRIRDRGHFRRWA
jgi:hypothetical protein